MFAKKFQFLPLFQEAFKAFNYHQKKSDMNEQELYDFLDFLVKLE